MALGLPVEPSSCNAFNLKIKNGRQMTAVHFAHPLQASVIGLLVEVAGTPEVLAKISKPLGEAAAQNLAKLIADDMRDSLKASHVSTVVAAGLIDEAALDDEDLDIIEALEHVSEQYVAAKPGVYSVALSMTNNGLDGICFPQLEATNDEKVSSLCYCVPISIVGSTGALDAFEEAFYDEERTHLHFADTKIADALEQAFGLSAGELKVVGYEDLDYASEALGTYSINAKMGEISRVKENGGQVFFNLKRVPVFVAQGKVHVGFFTFDALARRAPHILPGGDLEDEYMDFQMDFRYVLKTLTDEGLAPVIINYPTEGSTVRWEDVLKAPREGDILIERAHEGLDFTESGEADGFTLVCMSDPESGALVGAIMSKHNEEGHLMAQTNLYPLTLDGMALVMEYGKAIAQREGLALDIIEGQTLYIDDDLRVLKAPAQCASTTAVPLNRTLH
jgi:hypothetical protein